MKAKRLRIPANAVSCSLSLSVSLPLPVSLPVPLALCLLRHWHWHWKLEGRQAVLLVMVIGDRGVGLQGSGLGRPRWRLPGNWMLVVVVHGAGSKQGRVAACVVVLVA